ncbi:MAG: hypothetical protein SVZ03_12320 [Spirochaetota bacterium]|nr:hypothetical protein [Spirochaetota bacterium]
MFNRAKGEVKVTADNPVGPTFTYPVNATYSGDIGEESYGGSGINITYIGGSRLSYSFSSSGIINSNTNYYNDFFHNGLVMKTYTVSVSYDTNFL